MYMLAVRLLPSPPVLSPGLAAGVPRGLPVLVHEVSRRGCGLRLRRTEQELALSLLSMLPSAHYKVVGVRKTKAGRENKSSGQHHRSSFHSVFPSGELHNPCREPRLNILRLLCQVWSHLVVSSFNFANDVGRVPQEQPSD